MARVISQSIGQGGYNSSVEDIKTVQELLNQVPPPEGGPTPKLVVEGKNWGDNWNRTVEAIRKFQRARFNGWSDGRVDPEKFGSMTMKALNASDSPAAPAGSTITISTQDVIPQQFTNCEAGFPQFLWKIKWITSGRGGFLIQEVISRIRILDCPSGESIDNPTPFTPRYWEVWTVDSSGNMAPASEDTWIRHGFLSSKGEWTVHANVFWVNSLDPAAGFAKNKVKETGTNMLGTTTAPKNLGSAILTRKAAGKWVCCGDKKTHTRA